MEGRNCRYFWHVAPALETGASGFEVVGEQAELAERVVGGWIGWCAAWDVGAEGG